MDKQINVTRSSMPAFEEYCAEIKELWETRWLSNKGAKHCQLEQSLKEYLGVTNAELFVNGHLALEVVLQAMELSGEVITTPFTFASTTHAIVKSELTPVFCDVNDKDFTLDVDKIEDLITEKTCAIMPVHVYGNICDVEAIEKIAQKHHLKVIYDSAHAFGVKFKERGVGTYGDVNMFSFHATKVFHSIEGGLLTFGDVCLKENLNAIRNFGMAGSEDAKFVGTNAKMNEFQAAMGICNLRHIDDQIGKRKQATERYRIRLSGIKGIRLIAPQEDVLSNYAYFPVFFDGYRYTRDEVQKRLAEENIFARKYFYPLTSEFACYRNQNYKGDTPVAKWASEHVLTLPLFADLTIEDVDRICDIILK